MEKEGREIYLFLPSFFIFKVGIFFEKRLKRSTLFSIIVRKEYGKFTGIY